MFCINHRTEEKEVQHNHLNAAAAEGTNRVKIIIIIITVFVQQFNKKMTQWGEITQDNRNSLDCGKEVHSTRKEKGKNSLKTHEEKEGAQEDSLNFSCVERKSLR